MGRGGPGGWSQAGSSRAIDAVHFPGHANQRAELWNADVDELSALVKDSEVEIVEAKKTMRFDVIGQGLAGAVMFARSYPTHGRLTAVALVRGPIDVGLDCVCHRRGIDVTRYKEQEIAELKVRGGPPLS